MCDSWWQTTVPEGGVSVAMDNAFPAVPVITGKTSRSVSKISQQRARKCAVISSRP
jgi:hypothetical protein